VARRQFEAARADVQEDLDCCADDPKAVLARGLVHVALGMRNEAIHDGEAAVAMLPISRDAYDGAVLATNLAAIYAQSGAADRALHLLQELQRVPMAATAGTLRVELEWDSLRSDPRFQRLL
jgi:regulator of sirC expression with transglutaminase-like and TPR domain